MLQKSLQEQQRKIADGHHVGRRHITKGSDTNVADHQIQHHGANRSHGHILRSLIIILHRGITVTVKTEQGAGHQRGNQPHGGPGADGHHHGGPVPLAAQNKDLLRRQHHQQPGQQTEHMHHGRPRLDHVLRLLPGNLLIQPRNPGVPHGILQNPYHIGNRHTEGKPAGCRVSHNLLDENPVRLIHDLHGQGLRNQRQAESQTVFPVFFIKKLLSLPPDQDGDQTAADDLRQIIADNPPVHQFLIQSLNPPVVDQDDGEHRSRDDSQYGRRRAELVTHHLLVSSLYVQHTGVSKHIQKQHVKHQIVHITKRHHLLLKNHTDSKKDGDRDVRQRVHTGYIPVIIIRKIMLGHIHAAPEAEGHDRVGDEQPGLVGRHDTVLRLRQQPGINRRHDKIKPSGQKLRHDKEKARSKRHLIQRSALILLPLILLFNHRGRNLLPLRSSFTLFGHTHFPPGTYCTLQTIIRSFPFSSGGMESIHSYSISKGCLNFAFSFSVSCRSTSASVSVETSLFCTH